MSDRTTIQKDVMCWCNKALTEGHRAEGCGRDAVYHHDHKINGAEIVMPRREMNRLLDKISRLEAQVKIKESTIKDREDLISRMSIRN